jgi:hypothetical protein
MNATWKTHRRNKLKAHFVIALLALVAISPTATTAQQTPANRETTAPPGPQVIPDSKVQMTFALKLISDGFLCPRENLNCADHNIWWKSFTLLASDGHTLYLTSIPFPSGERSRDQFESSIKGAEKILRRTMESNSKGEQVGERALGFFSEIKDMKPPSGVPHYQLFWTRGPNYWVVNGEHLEDVLALEERLKSEGVNVVWTWHSTKRPSTPD